MAQKINIVESHHVLSIVLDLGIFMDVEGLLKLASSQHGCSETIGDAILFQGDGHRHLTAVGAAPRLLLYLSSVSYAWTIALLFLPCCLLNLDS